MNWETDEGREAVVAWIKAKMAAKGISYPELGERLAAAGAPIERTVLHNKIKRGTFGATFLLQLLSVLEIREDFVKEVSAHLPKP